MKELGFIRVAAATPQVALANPIENGKNILALYKEASEKGCAVAVFPRLCITGSTCGDLVNQRALQNAALSALNMLLEESKSLVPLAVVGLPIAIDGRVEDCSVVIHRGSILGVVPMSCCCHHHRRQDSITLLGRDVPFGEIKFECSDMADFTLGVYPEEDFDPMGVSVAAVPAASDEIIGRGEYRTILAKAISAKHSAAYVYAGAGWGESTGDGVYSGCRLIAERGELLEQSELYTTGLTYADVDVELLAHESKARTPHYVIKVPFELGEVKASLERKFSQTPFLPKTHLEQAERAKRILEIQAQGLARRLTHTRSKTLIIGISGGLDSCLALLVMVRTMKILNRDTKDIIAITMPCFGTTGRTRSNAEILCEELGVTFKEINIGESVKRHFEDIGHDYNDHSVTFENSQARERTQVLMDVANMENGLVVGTGDLSELALGWATYNGDHMSMYGVNASVPKTLVRHLVRHAAEASESEALKKTLLDILDTPVSPELLPTDDGDMTQMTEDLVGPYELHDFFLFYALRYGFAPSKIFALAKNAFEGEYSDEVILKWLNTFFRRFFTQQFKRSCLPDGPRVGTVSLSPRGAWSMPSDAVSTAWLEDLK